MSRKALLTALILAALSVITTFTLTRHAGPWYGGRTVAHWFSQYARHHAQPESSQFRDAERALLAMGTNAIPYLALTHVSPKQPLVWKALRKVQPLWPRFVHQRYQKWKSRQSQRAQAMHQLFRKIEPPGGLLIDLFSASPAPTNTIAWAAQFCGPEKEKMVPWVAAALNSADTLQQSLALQSVTHFASDAPYALEHLIATDLSQTPLALRWLRALQAFGSDAAPAAPMLNAWFDREQSVQRQLAIAQAMCVIAPEEDRWLSFLIRNLPESEQLGLTERWRFTIYDQLQQLGPRARPAIPALLDQLRSTKAGWLRLRILHALRALEADEATVLRILWKEALPRTPTQRLLLSEEILTISPGNERAVRMLGDVILTGPRKVDLRHRALTRLGMQGPAASSALPAIDQLLADPTLHRSVRDAAERARHKIFVD